MQDLDFAIVRLIIAKSPHFTAYIYSTNVRLSNYSQDYLFILLEVLMYFLIVLKIEIGRDVKNSPIQQSMAYTATYGLKSLKISYKLL